MENLRIVARLSDGSMTDHYAEGSTGREVIEMLLGDDWGPPPVAVTFEATDETGVRVRISIPYDQSRRAHVVIDTVGEE